MRRNSSGGMASLSGIDEGFQRGGAETQRKGEEWREDALNGCAREGLGLAGESAQCHLNNSSGLLASGKTVTAMPSSPWERSALLSVGVNTFSSSVEQAEDLALVGVGIRCRLESVPGGADHVEREGEAELPWRKIMASRRQSHYGAHQIVGRHSRKQFFLHHAFVAGGNVMQLYRSF